LGRHVALKVIISGEMAGKKEIDRFLREAKATAQLKHPNIITVYDIGVEDDSPYFTMDLIEGMSLKEYLQKSAISFYLMLE